VWHAFTEFLLFLLPLVGISRWRRILARSYRKLSTAFLALLGRSKPASDDEVTETKANGELSFLPERTCAICYRDQNPTTASEADILASSAGGGGVVGSAATDITNPYEAMPCGCIYCFACIAQRIANEEGEGWTCLRCGDVVKECKPWTGDIIEPQTRHQDTDSTALGAKVVAFESSQEEKEALREVEPMPEETDEEEEDVRLEKTRGLDLGDSLAFTESSEWARESESQSESEDEQSEEYDEDEEEEGEELGGGGFGFDD
jgi:peroxin-2